MEDVSLFSKFSQWMAFASAKELKPEVFLSSPALVFAPHQDDETLGCGGIVCLKAAGNTPVTIVYMTDGVASQESTIDMVALRKSEALQACEVLGVNKRNVSFLGLPDGNLTRFKQEAMRLIQPILSAHQGYDIYIPEQQDGHPDHEATADFVLQACRNSSHQWMINEYLVWKWHQYPIVPRKNLGIVASVRQSANFVRDFIWSPNVKVSVKKVLALKTMALEKHISQMTRQYDERAIPLGEVAGGRWLACVLSDYEVFKRYRI